MDLEYLAVAVALWLLTLVAEAVVLLTVRREATATRAALPQLVRDEARKMMGNGELDDAAFAMLTRLSQRGTGAMVLDGLRGALRMALTKTDDGNGAKKPRRPAR